MCYRGVCTHWHGLTAVQGADCGLSFSVCRELYKGTAWKKTHTKVHKHFSHSVEKHIKTLGRGRKPSNGKQASPLETVLMQKACYLLPHAHLCKQISKYGIIDIVLKRRHRYSAREFKPIWDSRAVVLKAVEKAVKILRIGLNVSYISVACFYLRITNFWQKQALKWNTLGAKWNVVFLSHCTGNVLTSIFFFSSIRLDIHGSTP